MFGLSTPFLAIIAILIILRIVFGLYLWYNRKRLTRRIREILD